MGIESQIGQTDFLEIGDGRLFLVFGGRLVIGRGDYSMGYHSQ